MVSLNIEQIPVLGDNYIYLLRCPQTGITAALDPALAQPVQAALKTQALNLILNTHHHADHTGGNIALKKAYGCQIIASGYDAERIPGIERRVRDGDKVKVGACVGKVLFVPGHTRGHIAFYFPESKALFCGDTLFAGGCGRLFEGTAEQMFLSLKKLKALPDQTRVYCAHEYTKTNYIFAQTQAPKNKEIARRLAEVNALRAAGKATVPSLLGEEKRSNLFLLAPDVAAFSALRKAKDAF